MKANDLLLLFLQKYFDIDFGPGSSLPLFLQVGLKNSNVLFQKKQPVGVDRLWNLAVMIGSLWYHYCKLEMAGTNISVWKNNIKMFYYFLLCEFCSYLKYERIFIEKLYSSIFWRYTNAALKICQYLCFHMKTVCWRFHIKMPFTLWDIRTWDMWKFCL